MLRVLSLQSRQADEKVRGFYGFAEHQPPQVDKQYLINIGREALYRTQSGICNHRRLQLNDSAVPHQVSSAKPS